MVPAPALLDDRPMADVAPTTATGSSGPVREPTQTSVNAVDWSRRLGHDQGQLRASVGAILAIGGQRPVDAEGHLLHAGDAVAQAALALDNLTDVVVAAGMTLADLAHLRIYATTRAALLDAQLAVSEHLATHGATAPVTAVQVSGLAIADMEVEIDGLAVLTDPPTEGTLT